MGNYYDSNWMKQLDIMNKQLLYTWSEPKFLPEYLPKYTKDDITLVNFNSKKHTEFQALFSYQSPTKVPQFKIEENYYLDLAIKQGFFNNRLQVSFSVSDVFDTSEWQARSNTDTSRLANYSKEATHAYWIGLTFNFNNFTSRSSADDSHPQKRQIIQLGQ